MSTHPPIPSSRRQFLRTVGRMSGAALVGFSTEARASTAKVIETKVISQVPQYYHGWPTLARRKDGTLLVVCSGGRQKHVCPFGRVELIVSHDDGKTWSWPRTLLDTDIDDRDAGVVETPKGSLLATTFTSLYYEQFLTQAEGGKFNHFVTAETLPGWKAAHERVSAEERQKLLGEWVIRSTDGGLTWSAPVPSIVGSPHGPVALKDGRMLYLGKEAYTDAKRVGACESTDDGQSWQWLGGIPTREGDDAAKNYWELHAVEADDGTIIAHIRVEGKIANSGETLQSESKDGGKTWSEPHSIGVWGLPSHLLKLNDGRLLMTYGHRRAPFGNQVRLSEDNGKTWGEAIVVSGDGAGVDLGYPSTAQLADGSLLTVWYESMNGGKDWNETHGGTGMAVLRQAHWTLP
ncbi:MAG TPA: sialidase family protein [Bacteroidia bacterium]|nr:sialidase family protein [Bacteroidia bacterium]